MTEEERAFFDACVHEGMQSDGYAIQAALRAFRRWRTAEKLRYRMDGTQQWQG